MSNDPDEIDRDELKQKFGGGEASRYDTDADAGGSGAADHSLDDPIADAIRQELLEIEYSKLSVNDDVLASTLRGYEAADELPALYERFADALGLPESQRADSDDVDRSAVLRVALRVAFQEGAPDAHEKIRAAKEAYAAQTL